MIPRRTTEARWVAPLCDPAMHTVDVSSFTSYAKTRDLKRLGADENGCLKNGEKLSLFKVRPLKQAQLHLLDNLSPFALTVIFQKVVTAVKNCDEMPWGYDDDSVTDEFCEAIGFDIVRDIAMFAVEQVRGKNGSDLPFSLPAGWREERAKSQDLRALFAAEIANAKSTTEKPGSE